MIEGADAIAGDRQRARRRSAGRHCRSVLISSDLERDRATVTEMWQCCHCGAHHPEQSNTGKLRGWCTNCNARFCGPLCETCVPLEQLLANLEAGLPFHLARRQRPIRVSAGGVILGRK